jgi:hypothetical protein
MLRTSGRDHTELSHVTAYCIDQRNTLPRKKFVCAIQDARRLLRQRLDRSGANCRSRHCFADRRGVVLLTRDIGLHIRSGDHSGVMAKSANLACPVMRRGACLQSDNTRRQLGEEAEHLLAAKLLLKDRTALCIRPMNLKNSLGQIKPNRRYFVHG